jgi:hypothetical protein
MKNFHNSRDAARLAPMQRPAFLSFTPDPAPLYLDLRANRCNRSQFLINGTPIRNHRKRQKTNNSRHF